MFALENLKIVRERVVTACQRVGRDPSEVTLVGVTKTVSPHDMVAAYEHGLKSFGENRVQEAIPKIEALAQKGLAPRWHLIGHLQTNKAKRAAELFDVIQSVDSVRLAEILQRHAEACGRMLEIFVQVNTSGEGTKSGVAPQEALQLIRDLAGFSHVRVTGLMTIGALDPDSAKTRLCFRLLRELGETVAAHHIANVSMRHLSMGMTDDFEIAIAEGSTMIRVGRALFGERP